MAYRLRIVSGPGSGTDVPLDADEITIGRGPENGVVINDNNVTRVHARVTLEAGGRVVVADAGSRNGVFVNDRKVAQQPIGPGDRVVIGQTVMELVSDGRGGAVVANSAHPPARAGNVPATGQMRPAARPGARPMARTGAVARAAKPGGAGKTALFAVVGVSLIFLLFAIMSAGGSGGPKRAANFPGATAHGSATQPPFPGWHGDAEGPTSTRISKAARYYIDVGDSNMISGNYPKARDAFRMSKKADPTCGPCDARLTNVNTRIAAKVLEYERAGQLQYDSGDYKGAIERWQIAYDFIGEVRDPHAMDLKNKIDQASKLIRRQPQ